MTLEEFDAVVSELGVLVLDVRHQKDFLKAHIPNSLFIGLDGGFAIGRQIFWLITPLSRICILTNNIRNDLKKI